MPLIFVPLAEDHERAGTRPAPTTARAIGFDFRGSANAAIQSPGVQGTVDAAGGEDGGEAQRFRHALNRMSSCAERRAWRRGRAPCAREGLHKGVKRRKGGGLRRLNLGTRISYYRCSLPGLAGFAAYRREEPTEATIGFISLSEPEKSKLAEREGFEPSVRFNAYTHFPGVLLKPLGHLSVYSFLRSRETSHEPYGARRGSRTLPAARGRLKENREQGLQNPPFSPVTADRVAQCPSPIRAFRCPTRCWRANGAPRCLPS
jgi:hypothetical protein